MTQPAQPGARDEAGVAAFVEHFGSLMQSSGMPGLTGHVFALLLADHDARMTAQEIGDALHVSAAAVSTATNYLSNIGVTRKVREPGSRRVVHALVADDWYAVMLGRNNVMQATLDLLREGVQAAGGQATEAGRRLWLNAEMFDHLAAALSGALRDWDHRKAELLSAEPSR